MSERPEFQALIDAFAAEVEALEAAQQAQNAAQGCEQGVSRVELPLCDSRGSGRPGNPDVCHAAVLLELANGGQW